MSFEAKYRLTFFDTKGVEMNLDILTDGYSGAVNALTGAADPVIYGYEKNGDALFEPIKSTIVTINLVVAVAGTYDEFYDIGSKQYLVKIYRSGLCFWTGWMNDEIFQEEYSPGFYNISLTATDGLVFLKSARTNLTGRQTHFAIIKESLDEIGLGINIVDAIDIHEDSHTNSNGPLVQTMFDADLFADNGKRYTLSDTLREVLFTYGARIVQHDNKWVISSVESFYSGLVGYEYSHEGVLNGAWSYNVQKAIDIEYDSTHICLLTDGNIQKNKPWRSLSVKQVFGKVDSATVPNGSFSSVGDYIINNYAFKKVDNWLREDGDILYYNSAIDDYEYPCIKSTEEFGNYLFLPNALSDYSVHNDITSSPLIEADLEKEYIFSMKYAALQKNSWDGHYWKTEVKVEAVTDSGIKYLKYDSSSHTWAWVTTSSKIVIGGDGSKRGGGVKQQLKSHFAWYELTAQTTGFPGGKIRVTIYVVPKFLATIYLGFAYDEVKFYAVEIDDTVGFVKKTGTNSGDFTYIPDQVEFLQNDVPFSDATNVPLFYKNYLSDVNGVPTSYWTSGSGYEGYLSDIYLQSILNQYSKGILLKSFSIIGDISPNTLLIDERGRRFVIISFTGSLKDNQYRLEAFEFVEPNTATIEIATENYTNDPESDSSSSSSVSGNISTSSTTSDKMVAMLDDSGNETGPAGRLQDRLFNLEFFGNLATYVAVGAGYGLRDAFNDYNEVLFGSFPNTSTGNADEWQETDRLLAVGSGQDNLTREDALTIYKSRLIRLYNALILGDFSHGESAGIPGALRYKNENGFQGYNTAWETIAFESNTKAGRVYMLKGIRYISFGKAFNADYVAFAWGVNSAGASVNVIVLDDVTERTRFKVNVVADCTVRWIAYIKTN